MITIGDMFHEMHFYDHCKKFVYNHDLVVVVVIIIRMNFT